MDQATSSVRETAAFARRVVVRTLTVVGGAAAGTAIAWCLSSASATADSATPPQSLGIPVVSELASPVADAVRRVEDLLPEAPPAPRDPIRELGDRVKAAAEAFGERAEVRLPECADPLCGLDGVGRVDTPAPDDTAPGRSDIKHHPTPTPRAAGAVADPGVDPDQTAERTATGRAYSDGMSRRGSPAPDLPSLPDVPSWPAPFGPAPANVPASGHHGSAGNPADSPLFAALPWRDRTAALVHGLTVPATEAVTVGRVGAQPGVTPD